MLKWRYNILGLLEAVLILAIIVHGPAAQALAVSSSPNVGPVLFREMIGVAKKKCSGCGNVKLLDEFGKSVQVKSGHVSRCKDCERERARKYRIDYHGKTKESSRKCYMANRKKRIEYCRKYRIANREEIKDRANKRYAANREKIRKQKREWLVANREKSRACGWRRRAQKLGMAEHFTVKKANFIRFFWGDRCAVCGRTRKEEGKALAIDHWHPLSKGNPLTMSNAVLLCQKHNSGKWRHEPEIVFDAETINRIEKKIEVQVKAWTKHVNG